MAVLRGNLAPRGAIIKQSAASPKLMQHTGRAVVFDSLEDLAARIDDDALDVTPMTYWYCATPDRRVRPECPRPATCRFRKAARAGTKDMVRISDARMSGTAFGTIVLHITPESAVGGPLALVRNGDGIQLDVAARRIELLVDDAELRSVERKPARGRADDQRAKIHARLRCFFMRSVLQADRAATSTSWSRPAAN